MASLNLMRKLLEHRKKVAAAVGIVVGLPYVHFGEMNATYYFKPSVDWYDETGGERARRAPILYRDLSYSTYYVHTKESFAKLDKSKLKAKDLREARVGSVTNAGLREACQQAPPEHSIWLDIMSGATARLNANAWAIIASAKALRHKNTETLLQSISRWIRRMWPWKREDNREQFLPLKNRDLRQKNATDAWHTLRRSLVRAAYLAEAGYSIQDFAGLPTSHAIRGEIGKFGCIIESPWHHDAAAIGYKLLPRRMARGTTPNTNSDEIVVDMDVTIVFQGSRSPLGVPFVDWRPDDVAADWFVTNLHILKTTTKSAPWSPDSAILSTVYDSLHSLYRKLFREVPDNTPLPEGLRVHTGYYRRFKRIWPLIVEHIETTRAAVEQQNSNHRVNVQVSVAGHSQGGALATLTAMAVDEYKRKNTWHPGSGTDLFVFSSPPLFGKSTSGLIPNFDDTTIRCLRFSVDTDWLATILEKSCVPDWLRLYQPTEDVLQLSGLRCNVTWFEAHTDYSRLIRRFVAPTGVPELHLLTAGSKASTPDNK